MSDYKALYRKWRPRDFDDVCGQDGITDILKYEVENSKLSHAYLFCGSRGTGKTSCAKILSKAVNCENPRGGNPCNECRACKSIDSGIATDVIEMDAASNNGIGDVRDMQDEIAFTPALLKYRVYIIDEVHMMSTQAFNALLKTLEEPPSYVIFILATTEYNKLPTTIVSRCQRFDFRRISGEVIKDRLLSVAKSEGIDITEDAARVIARISRGGMRDAISLLELCAGARVKIDEQLVFDTVGSGNRSAAYGIIEAILKEDYSTVYGIVNDIVMKSGDISVFWQEIIDSYRDLMVVKNSDMARQYLDLTEAEYSTLKSLSQSIGTARLSYHVSLLEAAMADMQRAFNSKRSIAEIALTRMCDPKLSGSVEALGARIEELERELELLKLGVVKPVAKKTEAQKAPAVQVEREAPAAEASPQEAPVAKSTSAGPYPRWGALLSKIASLKPSLYSALAKGASLVALPDGSFSLKLQPVFSGVVTRGESDHLALIKGVIASLEGTSPDAITLKVELAEAQRTQDAFSELDSAINKF
ncbi:MAG: DNA polymerase III subunit gamma/tau [Clostridia bacterium]|nr:DNA polymerase III subunit gamma/tau [Clostridia bacterium]